MSVNKHPRLYVRIEGEEHQRWHHWCKERNMRLTRVIQHVFRKGRLPRVPSDLRTKHLLVELIRLRFYVFQARNNLQQIERLLEAGTVVGDLEVIRSARARLDSAIAELNQATLELEQD